MIFWGYLGDYLGISVGYLRNILGMFLGCVREVFMIGYWVCQGESAFNQRYIHPPHFNS